MKKLFLSLILVLGSFLILNAQERPKLVVGIVIDQMRYDYLYRFYEDYGDDGFKRLLNEGFSYENTMINYIQTYTAVGHASIYTGSVPSIHGIAGNDFIRQKTGEWVNNVRDTNYRAVGTDVFYPQVGKVRMRGDEGKCSPKNLLTTTITDELKLATDFKSKVISIAIKDRGAILPAGRTADAAYWFSDNAGKWLTSTFYMEELPDWLKEHNKKEFPKKVSETPQGNTITFEMAYLAIENEQLGKNNITDFLAVSFSTPDIMGHIYGVDSDEIKNSYIKLDKELGEFLKYLDKEIGKDEYLLFLTSDHGCAHNANFLKNHKINAGIFNDREVLKNLNNYLEKKFKQKNIVLSLNNYQVNFNYPNITKIPHEKLITACIEFLENLPSVLYVVEQKKAAQAAIPQVIKECIINGYNREYSGEIQIILKPAYYHADNDLVNTHGTLFPYDTHIPFILYGKGIKQGSSKAQVYITDIAATLAALLKIQMPNGCIGRPTTDF